MDWTGGVRRRFAPGKNNTVIQKQKAHFAKARSALNNTPKANVPFKAALYNDTTSSRHGESIHCQNTTLPRRRYTPRESRVSKSPRCRPDGSTHDPRTPRQIDTKGEIIHITSSSIPSTTSSKPGEDAAMADEVARTQAGETTGNGISEGQRLLLANRRRLLARSDWLGLSTIKPVNMKFRSTHDRDRIGKRRKVATLVSQKGRPAVRRLITPLFEERQFHPEHMMSGALHSDEVQVKIGTDALASQTQRSPHSQTPRLPTGRKASTDLGPLSEEPMLLGEEGDEFETMRILIDGPRSGLPGVDDLASSRDHIAAYPEDIFQHSPQLQRMPEVPQMTRTSSSERYDKLASTFEPRAANIDAREKKEQISAAFECNGELDSPPHKPSSRHNSSRHNAEPLPKRATITLPSHEERDGDDEAFWRRMMHLEEVLTSNSSVQAVKSSSLHATASTSSDRPALRMMSPEVSHVPSTPRGVGTQGSILHVKANRTMAEDSADLESPSTSLHAIQKLADQPAHPQPQCMERTDDDAAWRDFIIGSQSSSEVSLRHEGNHRPLAVAPHQNDEESVPSCFDVSGLGTSVESVGGLTQHAHSQGMHILSQCAQGSTTQRHSPRQHGLAMPQRQLLANSSAEADEIETDDIEQSLLATTYRSRLVQPAQSRILNPKRFQSTKRPLESVSSKTADVDRGRRRIPRRTTWRSKDKVHSVLRSCRQ